MQYMLRKTYSTACILAPAVSLRKLMVGGKNIVAYEVIPFSFEGYMVRTIQTEDGPRFVIKDLGDALGIKYPKDSAKSVLIGKGEYRADKILLTSKCGKCYSHKVLTTNESGLYAFIMRSNKPNAAKLVPHVGNK